LYVPTPFKKGKPDYIIKFNGKIFDECPEAFTVEENGSVAKVNLIKVDIIGLENLDRR
jgi:hypothetical protein